MKNKCVIIKTRKEWREWLLKNHDKEKKVSLISYKKHTGIPSISHKESIEEAICFGWIDTTAKRLDEEKFQRVFVKRGPNANWSKNTLSYAKQLIKEGQMEKSGLKAYNLGKNKLPQDHDISYELPSELIKFFDKDEKLYEKYKNLAPSYKKMINSWINRAKRNETKVKRINIFLSKLRNNEKVF